MYAFEGKKSTNSQPTTRKPNQSEIEAVEGLEDNRTVKYSDLRFAIKERSNKSFKTIRERSYTPDNVRLDGLDLFARVVKIANISWYIDCGTLLGSYRHHEFIAWDHDLDVCVNRTDRIRTNEALDKYMGNKFHRRSNERWTKLYMTRSKIASLGSRKILQIVIPA